MRKSDDEKRGWTLVAIFLLIGLLCVIVAGNLAIRFVPSWTLQADMRSHFTPDSVYFTSQPGFAFPPIDPAILTPPVWINVFLTPGQTIPTRVPSATVFPDKYLSVYTNPINRRSHIYAHVHQYICFFHSHKIIHPQSNCYQNSNNRLTLEHWFQAGHPR